jgi:DNA-binding transcriptional LysR family regulator
MVRIDSILDNQEMESLDLNLVAALDALLTTNSVTEAAELLHTSAPAMSRTLARLRRVVGDPLLVRAGRGLVPTPRALELRGEAREVVERARGLFAPSPSADPALVRRTLSLQAADVLVAGIAPALLARVRVDAPGITLRFWPDALEGGAALRDGVTDLEVGVIDEQEPEVVVETVARLRMVGVVRADHPLAARNVTVDEFAAADHVVVSRRGKLRGPIDEALDAIGKRRRVVASVPTHAASLLLIRSCDVVGLAPAGGPESAAALFGGDALRVLGLRTFELPLELPPVVLAMAWHPRNTADRAHRWLRTEVRALLTGS